jgi:uncharacterized membrane protein
MTPARKTVLTVVIGAVVALTPPVLGYLQSRSELQQKYAQSNAEADAGYKTLVESVRELRTKVSEQHDTIARLQGHIEAIEAQASMRMTSAHPLPPVPRPTFVELPADLDAAQAKR